MRYYTIRVLVQSNPMERSARPPIAKRVWFDADEFFNIALSETESEGSERGMNHLTDFALLAQPKPATACKPMQGGKSGSRKKMPQNF
jgi:hypothetical protein